MEFTLYILECADESFYIGHTDDLGKRLAQHDEGKGCIYTSTRRPLKLIHSEGFEIRYEALTMERKLKGWSRAKKLAYMAGDRKGVVPWPKANTGINACRKALRLRQS